MLKLMRILMETLMAKFYNPNTNRWNASLWKLGEAPLVETVQSFILFWKV